MAAEWQEVRLGDLVEIAHGWPFKSELFSHDLTGLPIVVGVGNFRYTGGFRFDETATKEYRGQYPKEYELKPGDILLVMTCQTAGGEILGIPASVPDDGRIYLHNQRLGKVVIRDKSAVDRRFLYWLFLTREFNRELVNSASGTKIVHTAPSRIEAFRFKLPSLAEQREIAQKLDDLNDKIELNQRLSRTLEAMARALFKSWFVDFDPVRAKAEGRDTGLPKQIDELFPDSFEDSELGEIPRGWIVEGLDEAATFLNGLALQNFPPTGDSSLPVVKIAQLRAGHTVGADRATGDLPAAYAIDDGDVLFSWSGSLEVELWCGGPGALNQHLFRITSDRFPKWFYYLWTRHHLAWFRAVAAGKATTMGHIQRHHLHDVMVLVPTARLLHAMTASIAPLLDRLLASRVESRVLAAVRDALLPRLVTGEIRVQESIA